MRRNSMMTVKKSLAVMVAAAMVMSQGVAAFANSDVFLESSSGNNVAKIEAENEIKEPVDSVVVNDDNYDTGVNVESSNKQEAGATVNGDVTVENDNKELTGISASSEGSGSKSNTEVKGEVTVTNKSDYGSATGVHTEAESGGEVSVTTGNVEANSKGGTAVGVKFGDYPISDTFPINDTSDTSGILGISDTSGTLGISGISGTLGISGISGTSSEGVESKSTVTVNGDIDVSGQYAYGIQVLGDENSTNTAVINGNINAKKASGTDTQDGIEGILIESAGTTSLTVTGNIDSDLTGIMAGTGKKVDVLVEGNLDAGDTAIEVCTGEGSKINLTVEGTVTGDKHNIIINSTSDEVSTEGLNVTVWKIDTSNTNGRTAEVRKSEYDSKKDELVTTYQDYSDKAAEVINYIIKVDDTSKLTPGVSSAKEGEQVFLEVNVPSGYDIDSFYTAEGGTAVDVVKDSSGKYYLVVPRGGGVFVGVSLKANSNSSNSGGDDSDSDDGNDNDNNNNANKQGGVFAGASNDLTGKVTAGQTVVVGGQEINTNVIVKDAGEAVKNTFTATLSTAALTGLFDFGGAFVAVPADAAVKESFTFTAEGLEGFVTTYLELSEYKAGDVILCSYMDASGAMVTLVVTPDMINGTTLLLTIPANCTLALAGSSV